MNKMFGTNGIRGLINEELTVDLVLKLGCAIGTESLYRSFAEGLTQEDADRLCKIGVDMINKAIKKTGTTNQI